MPRANAQPKPELKDALDRSFASYESTRALAANLIRERKNALDLLILLCARLDALASDAVMEGTPSKKAFINFVSTYGDHKQLFNSVSIGDLYYELGYHRWLLDGMIEKPGRLHRFSKVNDPIIVLLEEAGLPLTFKASAALLDGLMRIIREVTRARLEPKSQRIETAARLTDRITRRIQKTQLRPCARNLENALKPLLDDKRVGVILYDKFRCGAIHGAAIRIDPQPFFSEPSVYWKTLQSIHGKHELIQFSAPFLLSLLERCIDRFRQHLLGKGKIPPDMHFHAFPDEIYAGLDFLDQDLLPEGGQVRLKINR